MSVRAPIEGVEDVEASNHGGRSYGNRGHDGLVRPVPTEKQHEYCQLAQVNHVASENGA
jgi:hypothetical protein